MIGSLYHSSQILSGWHKTDPHLNRQNVREESPSQLTCHTIYSIIDLIAQDAPD